ncbi:hypothetical protein V6U90_09880 [Micromonospora sp. CPCC 206060]|uniref:hypothetical protein n=1 Tax=Micromonospora sp. CPCC 206060 TaxID=3122406 RepID=UPI002FF1075F
MAIAVAALAMVLALVSLLVSWRALDQAGVARDIARAGGGAEPSQSPVARTPAAQDAITEPAREPTSGAEPGTTVEPSLDLRTRYTAKYEKVTLILRAGCDSSLDIDLDKPEVRVTNGEDLRFSARCGANPSLFALVNSRGSQADTPLLTPADCNVRIERAPIGPDITVPARKGVVICVKTSLADARQSGDTWKMALVEVTGTSDDGTVTIEVTAWDIPG